MLRPIMFRRNVGGIDRVLRVMLGGIFCLGGLLLLIGATRLGVILVVVGLFALVTGIVRFCVLYIPLGISTARPEGQSRKRVCDCAAWMKAMRGECWTVTPPASSELELESEEEFARVSPPLAAGSDALWARHKFLDWFATLL